MTSSIKPPGGPPPGAPTPDEVSGANKPAGAQGAKESFKSTLDQVAGASPAQASAATGGVHSIAADLKAGTIDAATAVDRLVAQTMGGPAAQALNEVGRAALESRLRTILAEDPALKQMVSDLTSDSK